LVRNVPGEMERINIFPLCFNGQVIEKETEHGWKETVYKQTETAQGASDIRNGKGTGRQREKKISRHTNPIVCCVNC
jgi:hypothetical protein